jgi:transposase
MRKPSTAVFCRRGKLQSRQLTVGLDLGDRSSFYCVLNEAGEVVLESESGDQAGSHEEDL